MIALAWLFIWATAVTALGLIIAGVVIMWRESVGQVNLTFTIAHKVIDEAGSVVVRVTITTEFHVPPEKASEVAEAVVVEIGHRLSGKDEGFIRERIVEQFWLDDNRDRPEEPTK